MTDDTKPEVPELISFWAIDGLPQYQFDNSHDVASTVRGLVLCGASPIVVRHIIEDANYPSVPHVVQPDVIQPAVTDNNITQLPPPAG